MRILSLYVAREFLKLFGFLVVGFVAIFTLFDFIEKVDNFLEAGVATSTMLSYFVLQVPEITALMIPMAILMASVLSLGLMAKKNEIVAVKSSGISMFRFTLPILLLSLVLALTVALINEVVLPITKTRTNFIWNVRVEKQPGKLFQKERFWYKGQDAIYQVGFYQPDSQSLSEVTTYRFGPEFVLSERIDAKRARYLGGKWVFFEGLYQKRLPGGGYSAQLFDQLNLDLPEKPTDFSRLAKPSEEMGLGELARYVGKVEAKGFVPLRQLVDLQAKLSFPFVCLIMALIGIPLALFKEKGRFLPAAVIIGLGVALFYWVGFSYCKSIFGYGGALPPVLAAWLTNLVFGLFGVFMFTHVKQ
ncbi:MAG: LPS export ABC transporter permease LptG [Desulfarculaceae bacterium]|nr:LPS export ABC transporter permease LptG [Desulfarculaceae bacterium]MCF8073947.1 LPS export ABC transporter permease LptG [Desulfarculaceae bacterium]MCF8102633.1 LPS export ABC transporter permease LptG [Desulfarculaceae bacterium]MCF8117598.1 LPS export ABC transporter permease LptG [Desulfarculaceae bacterium]